jgi:hypothetical protein
MGGRYRLLEKSFSTASASATDSGMGWPLELLDGV